MKIEKSGGTSLRRKARWSWGNEKFRSFESLPALCTHANASTERWTLSLHASDPVWPIEHGVTDVVTTVVLAFKRTHRLPASWYLSHHIKQFGPLLRDRSQDRALRCQDRWMEKSPGAWKAVEPLNNCNSTTDSSENPLKSEEITDSVV